MTFVAILSLSLIASVSTFAGAFVVSEAFASSLGMSALVFSACFLLLGLVTLAADLTGTARRSR